MVPPAAVAELLGRGVLLPWKVQEAHSVWLATRRETATTASAEAAERLLALTIVLAEHLTVNQDGARLRAMFEGALDVFSLPRHRQFMRGYLARHAIAEGDITAAEGWLAPCDPASDDLQTDSSYRFSYALLATAKRQFGAVIAALGKDAEDVPIFDMWDDPCTVLRANAWEQGGQRDVAIRQLQKRMLGSGRAGRQAMDGFIARYTQLHLCATTVDLARTAYTAEAIRSEAAVVAARNRGGFIAGMIVGVVLMFVGAVALAVNEIAFVFTLVIGSFGVAAVVLSVLSLRDLPRAIRRSEHLYRSGIPSYAGIVRVLWDEDQNGAILELAIEVGGRQTATRKHFNRRTIGEFTPEAKFTPETLKPGVWLPIRHDPQDPLDFIFET